MTEMMDVLLIIILTIIYWFVIMEVLGHLFVGKKYMKELHKSIKLKIVDRR